MSAEEREARRQERERLERKRPRGHGSISVEDDGYRARIWLPKPEGGKKEYKKRTDTVREAHAYLDDLLARYQGSGSLPARHAENPTFAEFTEQWLAGKKRGVSSKTYAAYEGAVRLWLNPVLGTMKVSNIRGADIQRVVEYLRTTPGKRRMEDSDEPSLLTHASQMVQFRPLKTILRDAQRKGLLTALPPMTKDYAPQETADVRVGVTDVRTRVISSTRLANVMASLEDDSYACTVENHAARRCRATWRVRFALGTRQGEHLSLVVDNWKQDPASGGRTSTLTLDTHIERIPHTHGCGGEPENPACGKRVNQCPERIDGGIVRKDGFKSNRTGKRTVALSEKVTTIIRAHLDALYQQAREEGRGPLDGKKEFLFGQGSKAYSWEQDRAQWHALWEYSVGDGAAPRVHDIRHTCASRLVNGGVPVRHVQKFLGHSDLATTERYLHDDHDGAELVAALDMHWTTLGREQGMSGAAQEREHALTLAYAEEPPDSADEGAGVRSGPADESPFDDD